MEFFAKVYSSMYYQSSSADTTNLMTIISVVSIISLIISLAVSVLMLVSMWKIFKKAGKGGWEAIVPVYNIITLLQITDTPIWYIALYCVPVAQIVALIITTINLAKKFNQSGGFVALLILLPVVGYPMLAFGKDKIYQGSKNTTQAAPSANPASAAQTSAAPAEPTAPTSPVDANNPTTPPETPIA